MAIGGGIPDNDNEEDGGRKDWGFGVALTNDLFQGSSSPCITFQSPGLAQLSSNGTIFEVSSLEVWAFTPCPNVSDAEQLELGRAFVLSHFAES